MTLCFDVSMCGLARLDSLHVRALLWRLCGNSAAATARPYVRPAAMLWCFLWIRAMQTCSTSSTRSSICCLLPGSLLTLFRPSYSLSVKDLRKKIHQDFIIFSTNRFLLSFFYLLFLAGKINYTVNNELDLQLCQPYMCSNHSNVFLSVY